MDHLFQLEGRGGFGWPAGGVSVDRDEDPFLFVEDENTREFLAEKDFFDHVAGDKLEAALDGDEDDVTAAITDGKWDDILDYLLYAERDHDSRRRVCEAIVQRSEAIAAKRRDDEAVQPTDLTVGR